MLPQIEAVLTRLDLVNASDTAAVKNFRDMLARTNLPKQIDELLAAKLPSDEVRAWLTEVSFVFEGVQHVG